MSFGFGFFATGRRAAKQKLHECYAPAAVKAFVEAAIDAMPWPNAEQRDGAGMAASNAKTVSTAAMPQWSRRLVGVFADGSGHFDESGENLSYITSLNVRPLFE